MIHVITNHTIGKTNNVVCTASKDSNKLWYQPNGIRTFAVHEKSLSLGIQYVDSDGLIRLC